jgi:hypothetical protein
MGGGAAVKMERNGVGIYFGSTQVGICDGLDVKREGEECRDLSTACTCALSPPISEILVSLCQLLN